MTDQQALFQYAQDKDAQAFRHLVNIYQRLVYSAARRQLANSHDIDDVVQQTFLELAHSSHAIREDLGSWLYSTALHNAHDLIRKDQTRRRHEALAPPPPPSDPHTHIMSKDEWQTLSPKIDDAILALPPNQRTLVIQHFFQNRSLRTLAADQKVSHPTIHRRLNSAIESLRKSLRAGGRGGGLPATPALIATLQVFSKATVPAPLSAELTKIGLAAAGHTGSVATASKVFALSAKSQVVLALGALLIIIFVISFTLLKRGSTAPPAGLTPLAAISVPVWNDVDDLPELPNLNIRSGRMYADGAGNIYATASYPGDTHYQSLVLEKRAGSATWTKTADLPGTITDITADRQGNLCLATQSGGPVDGKSIIFKRPVGQTEFIPIAQSFGRYTIGSLAFDSAGNLYTAGTVAGTDLHSKERWIVTKLSAGQSTLQTVDLFDGPSDPGTEEIEHIARVTCLAVVREGPATGIYVVGFAGYSTSFGTHWLVRKSTDAGASWSTVDDYTYDSTPQVRFAPRTPTGRVPVPHVVSPGSFTSDPAGNIYVAGSVQGNTGAPSPQNPNLVPEHSIIRKSSDGGASWTIEYRSTVSAMGIFGDLMGAAGGDMAGNSYVVGATYGRSGEQRAVIRSNQSGRWANVDTYRAAGRTAIYTGFAADLQGNLYVSGTLQSPDDGPNQWIIRVTHVPVPPIINLLNAVKSP